MGNIKVSVVMPIYNVEDYLRESLDSVLGQTLKEIEVICVNDGSTDGSSAILEEYSKKDERIIILNKENSGYGASMNLGIAHATGEYIGIVEPDDFILSNMYEELYQKAKDNDLDFVKADFYRFTRDDKGDMKLTYIHLSKWPEDYNLVFCPSEETHSFRYTMNTWSGIYRREFICSHQICHNESPGASFQDNGFYFQVNVFAKRAMILDRPFYMNRRDNPSSSMSDTRKVYALNAEYDFIRRILEQSKEIWQQFCGIYWVKKYHNYNGTIKRIEEEFLPDYIKRFAEEFRWGYKRGEVQQEYFTESEWRKIEQIISDPDKYCQLYVEKKHLSETTKAERELTIKVQKLERQLEEIKGSHSYRLGHAVMFLPGKVQCFLHKLMGKTS